MHSRAQLVRIPAMTLGTGSIPILRKADIEHAQTVKQEIEELTRRDAAAIRAARRLDTALAKGPTPECKMNPNAWDGYGCSFNDDRTQAPGVAERVYPQVLACRECPFVYLCREAAQYDDSARGVMGGRFYDHANRKKADAVNEYIERLDRRRKRG